MRNPGRNAKGAGRGASAIVTAPSSERVAAATPNSGFSLARPKTPPRHARSHSADARTPSRHTHRLDTGHREDNVDDLEDGEIEEIQVPAQTTAAPAPTVTAPVQTAAAPAPVVDAPALVQAPPPVGPAPAVAPAGEEEAMQLDEVGVPAVTMPAAQPVAVAPAADRFIFGQPAGTGQIDHRDPGATGPDHAFIFNNQAQADQHADAQIGDMEDIQDDTAPHIHAAAQGPDAAHIPVAAHIAAAAAEEHPNAEAAEIVAIIAAIIAAAALHPPNDEEIARIARMAPTNSRENPHGVHPAATQREPAGPEDLGTAAPFQPNVGDWRKIISSLAGLTADATPKSVNKIMEHLASHLLLVLSNGGRLYFSRVTDADEVFQNLFDNFLKDPGAVHVYHLPTEEKARTEGVSHYGGTIALAVRVENPDYRARLLDQRGFHVNAEYGGIFVAPETLQPSWVVMIYKIQGSGSALEVATSLREELITAATRSGEFQQLVQTYTHDNAPLASKCIRIAMTIDPRLNATTRKVVVYMKPFTPNAMHFRKATNVIFNKKYTTATMTFTPDVHPSTVNLIEPRCVTCKEDDHTSADCPRRMDQTFRGARDQINTYMEGPLAGRGGHGGRGGRGGRGGGRPPRGNRARGRGGRGT
ncbi:hypothetical protein FB451DRAFT_1365291 [Mycena latifolia]|nr:hypothetical protein FB451DRAFT_1365291 [Mycena latifolia]